MAKGFLSIDGNMFADYAEKIDKLGGKLKPIFDDALTEAAETIADDTVDAVAKSNLPARGKYSKGSTQASIIRNPHVTWSGSIGEVPVGFDKTKRGAGGFLITGTPKMSPDRALQDIYKSKRYENEIKRDCMDIFEDAVNDLMGR